MLPPSEVEGKVENLQRFLCWRCDRSPGRKILGAQDFYPLYFTKEVIHVTIQTHQTSQWER